MDLVDKFAKEHGLDRNRAILECIETGYAQLTGGSPFTPGQQRAFEEYQVLRQEMAKVSENLDSLAGEVRLMHHTLEADWKSETRAVPYQSRRWWEFWKHP
jgi:hypothetical protein